MRQETGHPGDGNRRGRVYSAASRARGDTREGRASPKPWGGDTAREKVVEASGISPKYRFQRGRGPVMDGVRRPRRLGAPHGQAVDTQ